MAIPPNLDLSAVLIDATRGWTLGSSGDDWTFAADGTGVRSRPGGPLPFTWAASPGQLTITYADGSIERATTVAVDYPDVFELEHDGVAVGPLAPR